MENGEWIVGELGEDVIFNLKAWRNYSSMEAERTIGKTFSLEDTTYGFIWKRMLG